VDELVFLKQANEVCDFRYIHTTSRAGTLKKKGPKISPNVLRLAVTDFPSGVRAEHRWSIAFQQVTPALAVLQTRGAAQDLLLLNHCSQR